MSKKLLIDYSESGVRTALTKNNDLREIFIDQSKDASWVGRVIVGRIQTILPGQFAFVDIGSGKNAFTNLSHGHGLKAGQPLLVQVYKDANRQKGAYVGREISVKGWLVILFESLQGSVGVSRKITNERENRRLKNLVNELLPRGYGAIVRTNAEGQEQPALAEEIHELHQLHIQIKKRAEYARPPAILYPDASTKTAPLLNDLLSEDLTEIQISGELDNFREAKKSICEVIPSLSNRIFHYAGEVSLFDAYNINRQISTALDKTVRLPCGGACTFEETEACVVIDVNTGKNIGKTDYRETVLHTNLEAATCIARQLTLRNLSGIILVDFIDMPFEDDKNTLMKVFLQELNKERIKSELIGMIGLGMVQLTRRKTRPSLSDVLETNCSHCGGKGKLLK